MRFKNVKLDPSQVEDRRHIKFVPNGSVWVGGKGVHTVANQSTTPSARPSKRQPTASGAAVAADARRATSQKRLKSYDATRNTINAINALRDRAAAKATYPQQNLATLRTLSAKIDAALASRTPVAPAEEVYGPPPTSAAAFGPGPDLASYLRPFDEAEARSRTAYDAALPQIDASYDRLRGELSAGQSEFAQVQARQAAEQAARGVQAQQQMQQLQGPVLADLNGQFGADTLGSLTGAVGAEAAQQQANLVGQGERLRSLAAEFAAQNQRSGQSRVADADLAQQGAVASAQGNLNNVLNQIGVAKAGAERQYANDAQAYQRQAASDPMDAINYQLKQIQLARATQEMQQGVDPLVELERQVKERQLRSALTPPGSNPAWVKKAPVLAKRSPSAFAYLTALTEVNGNARDALAGLQADLAEWQDDKRGQGNYVVFQGKRISPQTIRAWLKLYYGAS